LASLDSHRKKSWNRRERKHSERNWPLFISYYHSFNACSWSLSLKNVNKATEAFWLKVMPFGLYIHIDLLALKVTAKHTLKEYLRDLGPMFWGQFRLSFGGYFFDKKCHGALLQCIKLAKTLDCTYDSCLTTYWFSHFRWRRKMKPVYFEDKQFVAFFEEPSFFFLCCKSIF
jgi:hypothetical protein